MNPQTEKRLKTILAILKFTLLIGIIVAIPLVIYFKFPNILDDFRDINRINETLESNRGHGALIYISLQIFQIVVSVIPGQIIQLAAGYAFGFWLSYLLTIIGIGLGTITTFYLAKLLGRDLLYVIFGEKKLTKFIELLNSKKAFVAILIIFLFPGIPKDLFVYAAGISSIRLLPFLILNLVARTPALMCSLLVGMFFRQQSYAPIIVIAAVVLVIAAFALIFRKRVYNWIDAIYNRFQKANRTA